MYYFYAKGNDTIMFIKLNLHVHRLPHYSKRMSFRSLVFLPDRLNLS